MPKRQTGDYYELHNDIGEQAMDGRKGFAHTNANTAIAQCYKT